MISSPTDPGSGPEPPSTLRSSVGLVFPAWVLSLGVDFLLHGGVLARLYLSESPFLLTAESAFRRIPFGYLSFLLLTAGLWWLCVTLRATGWLQGMRVGLSVGFVVWGALALGLFSISTAPASLLLSWWAGQALELGLAGGVIGAGLGGLSRGSLWRRVGGAVLLCLLATVALQAFGVAPAMKIAG